MKEQNGAIRAAAAAYLCFLAIVLFYRGGPSASLPYWDLVRQRMNLRPLSTISLFLRLLGPRFRRRFWKVAVVNLLGNLILFIPIGLFLPDIAPRIDRWWKVFLAVTVSICMVELTQLALLVGSCDIDDLLLNVLGAMMGYGLRKLSHKKSCE